MELATYVEPKTVFESEPISNIAELHLREALTAMGIEGNPGMVFVKRYEGSDYFTVSMHMQKTPTPSA